MSRAPILVDALGLARWAVVGDQYRDPRQRKRQHYQTQRQPPRLIEESRQDQARHPHRHHDEVLALAGCVLIIVGGRGLGDQYRGGVLIMLFHRSTSAVHGLTAENEVTPGGSRNFQAPPGTAATRRGRRATMTNRERCAARVLDRRLLPTAGGVPQRPLRHRRRGRPPGSTGSRRTRPG